MRLIGLAIDMPGSGWAESGLFCAAQGFPQDFRESYQTRHVRVATTGRPLLFASLAD